MPTPGSLSQAPTTAPGTSSVTVPLLETTLRLTSGHKNDLDQKLRDAAVLYFLTILVSPEVADRVHRDHHHYRGHPHRLGVGCDGNLDICTNANRYSIANHRDVALESNRDDRGAATASL